MTCLIIITVFGTHYVLPQCVWCFAGIFIGLFIFQYLALILWSCNKVFCFPSLLLGIFTSIKIVSVTFFLTAPDNAATKGVCHSVRIIRGSQKKRHGHNLYRCKDTKEQWRKAENLIKRPQYEGQTPEDRHTDENPETSNALRQYIMRSKNCSYY